MRLCNNLHQFITITTFKLQISKIFKKTKTQSKYKIVKTIRPQSQQHFIHYEYNRDHHHLLTKWKGRLLLSFSLKESLFCFTIRLGKIHGAEPPKKGLGSSEATIHVWGGLC